MKEVIPKKAIPYTICKDKDLNIPIKMWLKSIPHHYHSETLKNELHIEEGALEQAKNLARLPFAFKHVAIMPDSHQGYGMPIGGVLATRGAIVPNAVGVDIGAVDKDTEILTKRGWIKINKYNSGDILVWDNYNENSFFDTPLLYTIRHCEEFTEYKSKYGLDQVLSDEHRMLVYEGYGKNKNNNTYFCRDFREKLNNLTKQDYYSVRTTFPTIEKGIDLTDEQIAIRIMVSADGHIRESSDKHTKIELHFKKRRKIDRSKILLKNANIDYEEYIHKDETVSIAFNIDWLCKKDLTDLYCCNKHQAKIIFNEYLHWDGSIDTVRNHKTYSTNISKKNADVIQYICALNGVRAGIHKIKDKRNENWNDCYNVYQTKNEYVGFTKPKKINTPDGKKYCFVVKTGYFIARRNNKIFITGNCGMSFIESNLKEIDKDVLKKLMGVIRKIVPVGFKRHKKQQDINKMPPANLNDVLRITDQEFDNALYQLGTLGGGNHFIEIQQNTESDNIGIMIHSGSRNIGFQIAKHYNNLAKKLNERWFSQTEKELNFLSLDSYEGQDYIAEMQYAVEFAKANRQTMMYRVMGAMANIVSKYQNNNVSFSKEILNVPHNYAAIENHFGSNVWVHRKGATRAYEGELGIIPGNQGSNSYIVKGKGNEDSFKSCSHGAGRVMSRKKARETLSLEEQKSNLDKMGIVHAIRGKNDLDEAPGSYKDIDLVMKNQEDLVEIVSKLKPLAVIKG